LAKFPFCIAKTNEILAMCAYLRLLLLLMWQVLSRHVGPDTLSRFIMATLRMVGDRIPNVRINVCKSLASIIPVIHSHSSLAQDHIRPKLVQFREDEDPDVKYFAEKALEVFAKGLNK
jgi:serine/threonine-protein phosphatase 2A regulatory subunit A